MNVLSIVELDEAAADSLSPLREAEVVGVLRVGRFEIDVELPERLDEDIKEGPA